VLDRQISAACVAAWSLWIGAIAMWVVGVVIQSPEIRALSIIVSAGAGTATIRTYFIAFSAMVRKAFEMDRDAVPTPLRPR